MENSKIINIVEKNYNFKNIKLEFLRKGGSNSYIIHSNNKYFMKIISTSFLDTAKQSISILEYLREKNFLVPKIIKTKNNMLYNKIDEKNIIIIFEFIEGREPNEGESIDKIGENLGKLHKFMKQYKGVLLLKNKSFFIDRYINIMKKKGYDLKKIDLFKLHGDYLWNKVKNLPKGFCHGDLHRGNLLKTRTGTIYFLDFDTACCAFPVYDIMIMCNATDFFVFNNIDYEKSKNLYEIFLSGYSKYNNLCKEEIEAFYDFIGVYHYQLQATIVEVFGLNCVDDKFFDKQYDWLMKWHEKCKNS